MIIMMIDLPVQVIEKFWKSTQKSDNCWNWTGPIDKRGNPIIRISDYWTHI